jgi:hypothetical protein
VGIPLYGLKLLLLTQWLHIVFGRLPSWVTDLYAVVVLALSISIFFWCPSVPLAWVSAYFSVGTLLVLLNVVLLRNVFPDIESPERTLLLFMCNLAQIVFMCATWYHLEGSYAQGEALRKSMLVLATNRLPRQNAHDRGTSNRYEFHFVGNIFGAIGRSSRDRAYYQTGVIATG